MEIDYDRDVRIDESALDVECLAQPRLMLRYGQASADAYRAEQLAKEKLEVVKAELDEDIRSHPEKYTLTKITEAVVGNAVIRTDRYQEANKTYIQAKYDSSLARTAAGAIDARKDMLELLVRLHGQQYFAGPSVPRDISTEWTKRHVQTKSDSAVSAVFRRRK